MVCWGLTVKETILPAGWRARSWFSGFYHFSISPRAQPSDLYWKGFPQIFAVGGSLFWVLLDWKIFKWQGVILLKWASKSLSGSGQCRLWEEGICRPHFASTFFFGTGCAGLTGSIIHALWTQVIKDLGICCLVAREEKCAHYYITSHQKGMVKRYHFL